MKAAANHVVQFHYEMRSTAGELIESSRDAEPVLAMQGRGNIVRGLDEALLGREAGERFKIEVSPEKAYGLHRKNLTQRVSKKYFPKTPRLRPGMQTVLHTREGAKSVTVLKVGSSVIDVDLNHPMAGQTVTFEIEVLDVREAQSEELLHGHPHGPGGHQH